MALKWTRTKRGKWMVWTSGPYMILRWRCHDNCGPHYAYEASYKGECLHGQEPFYDFGTNKPLDDAKRICQAHAEVEQLRQNQVTTMDN